MAAEQSSKEKALVGNGRTLGAFPLVLSSLERENRALKREVVKYKEELKKETEKRLGYKRIETKDTLNRRDNRLLVEAEYIRSRYYFPLPDNEDLEDKTQVKAWDIIGDQLYIWYVGREDNPVVIERCDETEYEGEIKQVSLYNVEDTPDWIGNPYPQDEQDEEDN